MHILSGEARAGGSRAKRALSQDPANAASSFQLSVGLAGTTTKTVKVPKNFTLRTPGPGYTCGRAIVGKPSRFFSADGHRFTQALSKQLHNEPYILLAISSL